MRHTTTLLLTALLLASAAVGCSSGDETAKDCAAALTKRTGGESGYEPTVEEAEGLVEAFDQALANMVRSGYERVAKKAYRTMEMKTEEGGEGRPEACGPLSDDDYTALVMATAIAGLGWTDEDGQFDKLKMVESLGN